MKCTLFEHDANFEELLTSVWGMYVQFLELRHALALALNIVIRLDFYLFLFQQFIWYLHYC